MQKIKIKSIHTRLPEEEYRTLTNLVKKENLEIKNVSESVKFCITYNSLFGEI